MDKPTTKGRASGKGEPSSLGGLKVRSSKAKLLHWWGPLCGGSPTTVQAGLWHQHLSIVSLKAEPEEVGARDDGSGRNEGTMKLGTESASAHQAGTPTTC